MVYKFNRDQVARLSNVSKHVFIAKKRIRPSTSHQSKEKNVSSLISRPISQKPLPSLPPTTNCTNTNTNNEEYSLKQGTLLHHWTVAVQALPCFRASNLNLFSLQKNSEASTKTIILLNFHPCNPIKQPNKRNLYYIFIIHNEVFQRGHTSSCCPRAA